MKVSLSKLWPSKTIRSLILGWVAVLTAVIVISSVIEWQGLLDELQTEASILHRLASQRADQHDAHLTSLSALAVAAQDGRQDLFLDVAATVLRFYPRIEAIDLVSLLDAGDHLTSRTGLPDGVATLIRDAASTSDGRLVLQPSPDTPGRYLIVKRSPNSDDARFGLSLQINANALLESDSDFWTRPSVATALRLPGGADLLDGRRPAEPQFSKALGSASQPLMFEAGITPGLFDLLPLRQLAAVAGIATLLYLIAALGLRQVVRARQAETQARLNAQDARLAHASRINALGEMASGMAHELTQPLTAILSQAQAGRHIALRGNAVDAAPVFAAIADQAKRGSAILDRLRNWTRPPSGNVGPISVSDAIRSVAQLLRQNAEIADVDLSTDLGPQSMMVRADQVELEQIIFNLTRNAMDAVSQSTVRQIIISAFRKGSDIVVEVADSGPGVPSAIKARIFEPFVTGKSGGTGLGLALSQRLAERAGGDLTLIEGRTGTVFTLRLPEAGFGLKDATA